MRKLFAELLLDAMSNNDKIILLTGDLGYGIFEKITEQFPNRIKNVGSAEQLLIGAGIGLALENFIPVCYSITPFLIKRPYEFLSLYANGENIPIKLVGSGRDNDYVHDGPSHDATDIFKVLETLPNIETFVPETNADLNAKMMRGFLFNKQPSFLSLSRFDI